MNTHIIGAQVARIRVGAPHEFSSVLTNFDPGTDSKAISASCFQANQEPVIALEKSSLVQQQPHRAIVVGNHNVDGTVVVDIPESCSAAYLGNRKGRPSNSGYLAKLLSIAFVVEQLIDLIERIRAPAQGRNTVHSTVGDKKIQMTVIVIVKPFRTESGVGQGRLQESEFRRTIVEVSTAIVDVKITAFMSQVSFEDVLISVIVKVRGGHTHTGLRGALDVVGSSRQ